MGGIFNQQFWPCNSCSYCCSRVPVGFSSVCMFPLLLSHVSFPRTRGILFLLPWQHRARGQWSFPRAGGAGPGRGQTLLTSLSCRSEKGIEQGTIKSLKPWISYQSHCAAPWAERVCHSMCMCTCSWLAAPLYQYRGIKMNARLWARGAPHNSSQPKPPCLRHKLSNWAVFKTQGCPAQSWMCCSNSPS